jgi:competence protein ComEC
MLTWCLAFLGGIWLASAGVLPFWVTVGLGLVGALGGFLARRSGIATVGYGLAAAAVGALLSAGQAIPRSDDVSRLVRDGQQVVLTGYVRSEYASEAGRWRRFLLQVRHLDGPQHSGPASGEVLLRATVTEPLLDGLPLRCRGSVRVARSAGNPGEFDFAEVLARRHVSALVDASEVHLAEELPLPLSHRVRRAAAGLRGEFVERLRAAMPGPYRDLYVEMLAAIVYGIEVTPVPSYWADAARDTGTIHLLVVSGSQLTLISWVVLAASGFRRWAIWRWVGQTLRREPPMPSRVVHRVRWWQAVLALAALAFFALMVGTGPSVSRALLMACLAFVAGALDLDYDPYTALGVAAAAICAVDTAALFSIGLQLSFAATLGVLLAVRALPERKPESSLPQRVLQGALAGSAGCWLLVTPLLAYHFHRFPLLGGLANVVAIPATAVALVLTHVAIPLSFIEPGLGAVPLYPARWMVDAIVRTNDVCRDLPGAYVGATHFPLHVCVLWYAVLAGLACAYRARLSFRWRPTPRHWAAVGLAAAVALALWYAGSAFGPDRVTVTFLDVGHGQCCLIEGPGGRTVVVDAGSGYTSGDGQRCARNVILPFLETRGIRRIDALVITHPDADHLNAVPTLLAALPVGAVLEGFADPSNPVYAAACAAAESARVPVSTLAAGGAIDLGGGARLDVLWPTGTPSDEAFDDNNRSVVLRLVDRQVAMLLPADIGIEAEEELLRRGVSLSANVLQAGHHGSSGASTWGFLQAVNPAVVVVSCPAGDAAHPAPAVQARWRSLGVEVWRTDQAGAVTVVSDGRRVRVRGHLRRRAQYRSREAAPAWAKASSTASGACAARAAASSVRRGRTASRTRWAISARTGGVSSWRRSRNRSMMPRSSGARTAAMGRISTARSSSAASGGASVSAATGSAPSRSFTTTVPAARSPSRLL